MNTNGTEKTLTSDWDDLDATPPKDTLAVGTQIGPYTVGDFLGHGGMGVVYQATHEATGATVALKTLHRVGPIAQQRLKKEFRNLCEVRHKNLVQLYELHTIDDSCFLTMEQIHGASLQEYLEAPTDDEPFKRIRETFQQIADGLETLHAEGLLHLDLKPDNVMVDRAGVPRILDFGLVEPLNQKRDPAEGGTAGTPRYIAPERRRQEHPSTASDWFAFGVMLAEFLVPGWKGPPANLSFPKDTPQNLSQLCLNLMADEPEKRPAGSEVVESLGHRNSGKYKKRKPGSRLAAHQEGPLAGRDHELRRLNRLLHQARGGTSSWLHLVGESGVGKTALTREFRNDVEDDNDVLVLAGTCHERESMPFQGVDGVLESLAQYLFEHSSSLTIEMRTWAHALEALSPSFADVARQPDTQQALDPVEKRREAFRALKALLSEISKRVTVLVVVDDVQWGDGDGSRLLAEVLAQPTAPRTLLVTTSRGDGAETPPFVSDLQHLLSARGSDAPQETMHLTRLTDEQLLECLPPDVDGLTLHKEEIVRAARGLPFLARALGAYPWEEGQKPSLDVVVRQRLREAPQEAISVMRAVALSPVPLPQPVALESVGAAHLRHEVLAALRHAGLIRTAGESPDGPLEPYHALVAKTVQEQLGEDAQQQIRLELAQSLERKALASAELLASLFHLGGDMTSASRWAPIAAREAERSLAFDSAAYWYGRAATWMPLQAADLLPKKARCLEFAGRSAAAAEVYEECAKLSDLPQVELVRAAGSAWLNAGHVDKGLAALAPELKDHRTPIPSSEKAALFKSMLLLWKLWRRGVSFNSTAEDACEPELLARVDATWNASKSLNVVMPMRGFALQLHSLMAALDAGEPRRVARSLVVVGPMFTMGPLERFGYELMESAERIAKETGDAYLLGMYLTFDAVAMSARWQDPALILQQAEQATAELKASGEATAWERGMAFTIGLRSLELLGRFDELQELGRASLAESVDRDDLFAQSMAHQSCAMGALARCDSNSARYHAQASVQDWSHGSYTVQHYYARKYEVQSALLADESETARQLLLNAWTRIESAQLLRNAISKPEILLLRGLVEIAAARSEGRQRCSPADKMARLLRKETSQVCVAHSKLLLAACRQLRSHEQANIALAQEAAQQYRDSGLLLQAACVEARIAQSSNDESQMNTANTRLREMGIQTPDSYLRTQAPCLRPI